MKLNKNQVETIKVIIDEYTKEHSMEVEDDVVEMIDSLICVVADRLQIDSNESSIDDYIQAIYSDDSEWLDYLMSC